MWTLDCTSAQLSLSTLICRTRVMHAYTRSICRSLFISQLFTSSYFYDVWRFFDQLPNDHRNLQTLTSRIIQMDIDSPNARPRSECDSWMPIETWSKLRLSNIITYMLTFMLATFLPCCRNFTHEDHMTTIGKILSATGLKRSPRRRRSISLWRIRCTWIAKDSREKPVLDAERCKNRYFVTLDQIACKV